MLFVQCGVAQVRSNKDLVGRWTGANLQLEFFPDGRVMFTMRGGTIPGARYKSDFTKTPAVLHIEIQQKSNTIVYKSTIEFINDDSLRLTTLDNDLANAFDKQRSVALKRKK